MLSFRGRGKSYLFWCYFKNQVNIIISGAIIHELYKHNQKKNFDFGHFSVVTEQKTGTHPIILKKNQHFFVLIQGSHVCSLKESV